MPSSKQRIEVWRGVRAKTSGGLTKADLVKNKRGKLVSKKKSGQAFSQNNLGSFLREKGKKVAQADMLRKKGKPPAASPAAPKKAAGKPKAKAVVKPPKPAAPKAQPAAKPKPKPKKPKAAAKKKPKSKINPITQQPYAKKGSAGFVADAKVHVDNIKRRSRRDKVKAPKASAKEIQESWEALLY
jgi:histone H1/5